MKSSRVVIAVLAAAAAFGLMGCSRSPVAPDLAHQPGAQSNIMQTNDPPAPPSGGGGIVGAITINGGDPGFVKAGRFSLIIPRNSLKMNAHIVLIQPDPTQLNVDFEITPPEANDFKQPVTLIADCSDQTAAQLQGEEMYWLQGEKWAPAHPSIADATNLTMTTHAKQLVSCMIGARESHASK